MSRNTSVVILTTALIAGLLSNLYALPLENVNQDTKPNLLDASSSKMTLTVNKPNSNKLRQDGDGEGIAEGFTPEVGLQVGNIVNGVLTGNVGDIFKGTLPFIPDENTQTGIGTIFESLTKPLNTLWATSIQQGQKYFGINQTTVNPLSNSTAAAVVQAATTTTEAAEDEDESDAKKKL